MAEPMSDERLAEIREEIDLGTGVLSEKTALELLAELAEARADARRYLDKVIESGRVIGDLQAKIATLKDELGSEQVKRHRAERERDQALRRTS